MKKILENLLKKIGLKKNLIEESERGNIKKVKNL